MRSSTSESGKANTGKRQRRVSAIAATARRSSVAEKQRRGLPCREHQTRVYGRRNLNSAEQKTTLLYARTLYCKFILNYIVYIFRLKILTDKITSSCLICSSETLRKEF